MKKRGPVSVSGGKEGGDECARYGQRDRSQVLTNNYRESKERQETIYHAHTR